MTRTSRLVSCTTDLIGNTPILEMDKRKTGLTHITLYAKLEHLNPYGSIKDRTAFGMIGNRIAEIARDKKTVLELSSGNAARGLQAIAALHGVHLETLSNRIRVPEMQKILKLQGAHITPVGELDPEDAYAALNKVDRKAVEESDTYFYTDQYRNPANEQTHFAQTGQEIIEDIGPVDYFIGAIGTAGSTVGISRRLKESNHALDITGVVSGKDDFIPGIRHKDEVFNVGPFKEDHYNRIIGVTSNEAIDGVVELIRDYGIMAGPSSGATYRAALAHLRTLDSTLTAPAKAVFVVFDRIELYLSYLEERRPDLFA